MSPWLLLAPPAAFLVILAAIVCASWAASRLALGRGRGGAGARPYACGEETPDQVVQPDYSQFFPFAFFFTIVHVAALMVATVPVNTAAAFIIALVYLLGAFIGLTVLYRR